MTKFCLFHARSGHVKLADFGSAARIGSDGLVLNKDNIATGTPEYVAPEVLLSHGEPSKIYGVCRFF